MRGWGRWFVWFLLASAFVVGIAYSLWPQPVAVETAVAGRSRMQVTVNEDGITRVQERYEVSSPVAGQLLRIELRSGDSIKAGETLLATIRPSDPSLLDAREVAQTEARAAGAKAAVERAEARRSQTKVTADLAEIQYGRAQKLRSSNSIAQDESDAAEALYRARQEEMRVANFDLEIAKFEYEQAQAALGLVQPNNQEFNKNFEIRSPISGSVLRLFEESTTVVAAGKPLLEVGDAQDLEIVVDVLSSDAVKVQPGNEIRIVHWGGPQPLSASVRVVEPAAFTKISALGVEEQRVNVIGDFRERSEDEGQRLGDGYRVEAEIVVWDKEDILQVPTAALFREAGEWCVFTVQEGRARRFVVKVGQRNQTSAEILGGLEAGAVVVTYPSDLVQDGVLVHVRKPLAGPAAQAQSN